MSDSSIPIIITEGEKKAAKADQEGFRCIGLGGAWSWQSKRPKDDDGEKTGPRELIPDLVKVAWAGRRVTIILDSDTSDNPELQWAEWHLQEKLRELGSDVKVVRLPSVADVPKVGLDDYLIANGKECLQELLNTASRAPRPTNTQKERRRGSRDKPSAPNPTLPLIRIDIDEHRVNDQAIKALAKDENLYSRVFRLVKVINEHEGKETEKVIFPSGPRIVTVTPATLRERMTVVANFEKYDGRVGDYVPATPTPACVQAVIDRDKWDGIRPLTAVVDYPVLLPSGEILATPGYDHESGILYCPRIAPKLNIPDRPTQADAKRSVETLLDLVADFPFALKCHKSAWISALLTILARFAFSGPTPLFLVDGNTPGCGKGLLVNVISLIVREIEIAVSTFPEEGEELRKRITAILLEGCTMALFDNASGNRLSAENLEALLTSTKWKDRILGVNENVEIPNMTAWFATGNNLAIEGDTVRRVCPIRLDSPEEKPEERKDIRIKNLRAWVSENRIELLSAALTILRAYHVADRPDMGLPAWGSYEGWSALIRNAVAWVGLDDPWLGKPTSEDDPKTAAIKVLAKQWAEIDPSRHGLSAAKIVNAIDNLGDSHALYETLVLLAGEKSSTGRDSRSTRLGHALRSFAKRSLGGLRIIKVGLNHGGGMCWLVETISKTCGEDGEDASAREKKVSDGESAHVRDKGPGYPDDFLSKDLETVETIEDCPPSSGEDGESKEDDSYSTRKLSETSSIHTHIDSSEYGLGASSDSSPSSPEPTSTSKKHAYEIENDDGIYGERGGP